MTHPVFRRVRRLILAAAGAVVLLSGCSLAPLKQKLAPDSAALDRNPQIHRAASFPETARPQTPPLAGVPAVAGAEGIDVDLHRLFLEKRARVIALDSAATAQAYFDTGGELINVLCGRWFAQMEVEERRLDSVDKSFDVWKSFGTTLLGLGKANAGVVSLYGGLTTVESGLTTAYKDVYLLNGSVSKVKQRIFSLLADYKDRARAKVTDYASSYAAFARGRGRAKRTHSSSTRGSIRPRWRSTRPAASRQARHPLQRWQRRFRKRRDASSSPAKPARP